MKLPAVNRLVTSRLLGQIGWVTGSYLVAQILRLGTNVVLARLLTPQLLGIMLVVNVLRTGVELLSDVGIGQNIVASRRGAEPLFYNTAWTLQLLRGLTLALVSLLLARSAEAFFAIPDLATILSAVALVFILTGATSPARFLMQKRQAVAPLSQYDMAIAAASALIHISFALYSPTIWALVAAMLASTAVATLTSFALPRARSVRLTIDRDSVREILKFGKWVFAASLVYFLAMNFDRLYLAREIPLALLGAFGVARNFSDMFGQIAQRIGNLLIFPKVAGFGADTAALRSTIVVARRHSLTLVALGLSAVTAAADTIVTILYDDRYLAAAFVLPILLVGSWFAILASMGESMLLGVGNSAQMARANAVKLVWMAVALPIALTQAGIEEAVAAIAVADLVRYISISMSQRSENLSFVRQDVMLTGLFVGLVFAWRAILTLLGMVPDIAIWWSYGSALNG